MKRRRFDYLSTSTLRAMLASLSKRPWRRLLRGFRIDIEQELLARDLPLIAEESGGFVCIGVEGLQ